MNIRWLFSSLAMLACLLVGTSATLLAPATFAQTSASLAPTPPMGWNSWNKFGCNVSDKLIREMADAVVSSGMQAAGYQYVNIDDCWQVSRDASGTIVADPARFPSGIKALADYVHGKGLKLGIYTDAGTGTCEKRPGSLNHEVQDAKTYASWGIDYVKIDWCNAEGLDPEVQYAKLRDALANSGRPIVFSICNWGVKTPWRWGPATGNLWRTTGDINDTYDRMSLIGFGQNGLEKFAGPGHWNDPDMLEVGNGGMKRDEYRTHMALWALLAAPLLAGNDLRNMSPETKELLLNSEVLAVDQDAKGAQGHRIWEEGPLEIWVKPLADGSHAVGLFNRSESATKMTLDFKSIGAPAAAKLRDLLDHKDLGTAQNSYSAEVPTHGVVLVKVSK
ncbi:MAG: Alpha-galactosidase [Candidatus Acidoferrum typicum]|jgi:alpha-galactosidase|nr:Alpha-galactosidase [Candidatus Acidoferrum typicum]